MRKYKNLFSSLMIREKESMTMISIPTPLDPTLSPSRSLPPRLRVVQAYQVLSYARISSNQHSTYPFPNPTMVDSQIQDERRKGKRWLGG
jgi:hypothetical protein